MKQALLFISFLSIIFSATAQTPNWQWVKADTNAKISINPSYIKHIIATSNDKVLWGVMQGNGMPYGTSSVGSYKLSVYDSTGAVLNSTTITGKFTLIDAKADDAGNWYLLGQYYDTVNFPGGTQFARNPFTSTESEYFIFRLNSGSLSLAWATHIGASNDNTVGTFTIANNALYTAEDSIATATHICKLDLTTGALTRLFTQGGQSTTSSIAVDNIGNIYLAGSCAFTPLDFNGHVASSTSGYPVYLVRYKASGAYDWSYFMNDVTCVYRKINIANNNAIYYTGTIHDTLSLAGIPFHRPAWLYDLMIAKLDSTGHVGWTKQLKDTISGDADVEFADHAAVTPDGSINILAETRKYVDWGNDVVTNIHGYVTNVSVINIGANGIANWALITDEDYTLGQHIAANDAGIWITGNGSDSTSLQFNGISVGVPQGYYIPYLAKIRTGSSSAVNNAGSNTGVLITIAPNPANNIITIRGMNADEETKILITDITGGIISEQKGHGTSAQINVASFNRGLYFIETKGKTYRNVQKIVLE